MKLNEIAGWRNITEPPLNPPYEREGPDIIDVFNELTEDQQWDVTFEVLNNTYSDLASLFSLEEFEKMYGSYDSFVSLYGNEDDNQHPYILKTDIPKFLDLVKQEGLTIEQALNEVDFVRLGDFFDMDTNTLRDTITDEKYWDQLFNVLIRKYPEKFD